MNMVDPERQRHRVTRIIAGNADEPDHWNDIAGYAVLPTRANNV